MICQQESPLLVIVGSSCGDRRIELRQDYMVVGREPTCDIWLDDPHVSRTHAALQCRGNTVYVTDLGSSGGTFVGDAAVSAPHELHPGDVVSFASVTARFEPVAGRPEVARDAWPVAPVAARPVAHGSSRESARTRSRWLCWTGLIVLAEGCAIAAITRLNVPRPPSGGLAQLRVGPSIVGVPAATLGLALALAVIGLVLLLAGLSQRP
jgi:hypothetical protein